MAIWLIAESWMGFLEVTGDPEDPAQVAKVTDLIAVTIAPYLTAKGRRSLTAELLAGGSRGRVEENQGHEGDTDDAS